MPAKDKKIPAKMAEDMKLVAYCVKCRKKRRIIDPVQVQWKNGMYAAKGKCRKCDTTVNRMLGREPIV